MYSRGNAFLCLVFVFSFLLAGCDGKTEVGKKDFTPEDFKKVQKGMTEAEVTGILGKPEETIDVGGGSKRLFWQVGDMYYSISFKEGNVNEPLGPTTKDEQEMMKSLGRQLQKMGQK